MMMMMMMMMIMMMIMMNDYVDVVVRLCLGCGMRSPNSCVSHTIVYSFCRSDWFVDWIWSQLGEKLRCKSLHFFRVYCI